MQKFLQQLMATSPANAMPVFSVYANRNLANRLKVVNDMVKGRSVWEVFEMLPNFVACSDKGDSANENVQVCESKLP